MTLMMRRMKSNGRYQSIQKEILHYNKVDYQMNQVKFKSFF